MKNKHKSWGFGLLLLFFSFAILAQDLPRSTPEPEGVSSKAIGEWINSYSNGKHELHSVMVLRHGKVIAEGWAKPYSAELKHTMYSVSKSWTSTAIGFLVDAGKIKVEDKVIDYFPEHKQIQSNQYLNELRIKDLLTMSAGHKVEPIRNVVGFSDDWVKGFLSAQTEYKPGTKFLYNTLATYMLSAIVERVSGQKTLDYLQNNLLQPLNIKGIDWETDPKGINVGGWGIRVKTEDMAKLGQLYLQKGKWNGKQILSENWVNQASSKQIEQDPDARQSKKDSSDWLQGYGYQFWRCRNGAFRADGAYGQYIVMFPEKDAVVVITSESLDLQDDLNNIWKHLLPAFSAQKLPANPNQLKALKKQLAEMHIVSPSTEGKITQDIWGKNIALSTNQLGIKSIELTPGSQPKLVVTDSEGVHQIAIKENEFALSETSLKGPYLLRLAKNALNGLSPFKVAASYYGLKDGSLGLALQYFESPHHWNWIISKKDAGYQVRVVNSFDKANPLEITGK